MAYIPQRLAFTRMYRSLLGRAEPYLVLPIRDPNVYQILSLILSIVYVGAVTVTVQIILVVMILISDWMDGAAARKYSKPSREGWMIDVAVDRISEGFIFLSHLFTFWGNIFFLLYLVNIGLSIRSVRTGTHFLLALRFMWLIFLAVQL